MIESFETACKAIADPGRMRILKLLESGELCVCQITTALSIAAPAASKSLSILKNAGLIQQRRQGRWVYYRLAERNINPHTSPILALMRESLNDDPTITHDLDLLTRVKAVPVQVLCDAGLSETGECE